MTRLFGTDGIRGEAGVYPLDARTVCKIGRSLARQLALRLDGRAPEFVTGCDTRESGTWIERALIAGAEEGGARCQSAGVITTPGVAYLARVMPADAGVVISASHNPYEDNGIKIFARSGRKLDDATERLIEADVMAQTSAETETEQSQSTSLEIHTSIDRAASSLHASELQARYRSYLIGDVGNGLDLDGLSIVIDCANGSASNMAPAVFERLGARVIAINNSPNGRNINLNCGSLHIEELQAMVTEKQADLGVAFDGDADRALFVDAKGNFVDGDATLWVMAKYLHLHGQLTNDAVVATVMSNIGLEIALRSIDVGLLRTDVGDKYVLEKLLETGASVGGEQSGHIIFPGLSLAGDGIITTLRLLKVLKETGETLEALTSGFTRYPQILVNVRVRQKPPFAEVEAIAHAARAVEDELGDSGRLLLRYSGTEPLARVMIQGTEQDIIERKANTIAAVINEAIGAS